MAKAVGWAMLACAMLAAAHVRADPAGSNSLIDALALAYETNPQLKAEQARLRATDEQVPQALSGYRPTVRAFSEVGPKWQDSNQESIVGRQDDALFQRTYGAQVEQPLYQGGQTIAAVRGAENAVRAERARLDDTEQTVLLDAVTAYANVFRDQAVLELNIQNEQLLARQLEAARDRFQVGEVTRTDVFQAEARLARATANRVAAEGNLEASRATYLRVVGSPPGALPRPDTPVDLPQSLKQTNDMALVDNPRVTAEEFDERSALDSVDRVRGELLPTLSVVGRLQRDVETYRNSARIDTASALLNLDVPLYQAGTTYSRLRQSKQQVVAQRRQLDRAQREAIEGATRAWNALETSRAEIGSLEKQVKANEVALDGVQREAEVGARTVLDILDAQQELVDSQVSLVRSQRDEVVAAYQLKSAVGGLTARKLQLPVEFYDPQDHYLSVRDRWIGGSALGDDTGDFDHEAR